MRQKRVHPLEPIPETNAKGNLRLDCGAPVLPTGRINSTLHLQAIKWKPIRSGLHSFDQISRPTTRRPRLSTLDLTSKPRPTTSPSPVVPSQFARTLPGATRKFSCWVRALPCRAPDGRSAINRRSSPVGAARHRSRGVDLPCFGRIIDHWGWCQGRPESSQCFFPRAASAGKLREQTCLQHGLSGCLLQGPDFFFSLPLPAPCCYYGGESGLRHPKCKGTTCPLLAYSPRR